MYRSLFHLPSFPPSVQAPAWPECPENRQNVEALPLLCGSYHYCTFSPHYFRQVDLYWNSKWEPISNKIWNSLLNYYWNAKTVAKSTVLETVENGVSWSSRLILLAVRRFPQRCFFAVEHPRFTAWFQAKFWFLSINTLLKIHESKHRFRN